MDKQSKARLKRFLGRSPPPAFTVDELQGLMLQISFAIMMIFMIAYFMFRTQTTREQDEQLLELQKQKLVAAIEKVERGYEARYGLTTLLKVADDGSRSYDAGACIENGRLTSTPILREAFSRGAAQAADDYADMLALRRQWWEGVLAEADVADLDLEHENRVWLGERIDAAVSGLETSLKGVQLLSAALLQRHWMEHPQMIRDPAVAELLADFKGADESRRLLLAADLAAALRRYSLVYLGGEAGAPMLAQ
ncbi:MAG: hypothetical protein ACOX9C_12420 [Kiritimatiellia bacterium]|jgi:hypothetical protein